MWKVKIAFVNSYSSSTLLITAFVCLFYIFRFFCALFSAQLHFGTPLARTCFTATSVVWNLNLGCIFKIWRVVKKKAKQTAPGVCMLFVYIYTHICVHVCICMKLKYDDEKCLTYQKMFILWEQERTK